MPLDYLKQAQAKMKSEGVIYPGDGIIWRNRTPMEADCVGMIVMPAMSWFSEDMFEYLISRDVGKIKTSVNYTYSSSTHKGDFTKDIIESGKMFDGMQLIGKDKNGRMHHIVTFYKEFVYDGVVNKDVVVDISGSRYKIDPETKESIINDNIKGENAKTYVDIRPFKEAYEHGDYKYWCAPDYIDYGDQEDPETGMPLTPQKTVEVRKKK